MLCVLWHDVDYHRKSLSSSSVPDGLKWKCAAGVFVKALIFSSTDVLMQSNLLVLKMYILPAQAFPGKHHALLLELQDF